MFEAAAHLFLHVLIYSCRSYFYVFLKSTFCITYLGCQTKYEEPCIFPFKYSGTTYTSCTSVDNDQPWCSTGNDEDGNYDTYGNCDMALCGNV